MQDDVALAGILGNINVKAEPSRGLVQPNSYENAYENQHLPQI